MSKDIDIEKNEKTIDSFVKNLDGYFIVHSRDTSLVKLIKSTVYDYVKVGHECLTNIQDVIDIYGVLKSHENQSIILFIDRVLSAGEMSNIIIQGIKQVFNNVYIVVLTDEVDQKTLINLYEIGADNIIMKPVTVNTVIEKIANTVKPSTKVEKMIEKVKKLIDYGSFDKTLAVVNKLLSVKPNCAAAYMLRGDIYQKLGKTEHAISQYKEAHSAAPLFLEPMNKLATVYEKIEDRDAYLNMLIKMDEISPLNVKRKLRIGSINSQMGQLEEANRYFEGALKTTRKQSRENLKNVALEIAESIMVNYPEEAEKYFRQALDIKKGDMDESDVYTYNRLGLSLRKQQRPLDAIEEYNNALKIVPRDPGLYYNKAIAYLELKNYDQALVSVNEVLSLDSRFHVHNATVSYNIGMVYHMNRYKDKAHSFFVQSLEINSNYTPAQNMLEKYDGKQYTADKKRK